MVWFCLRGSPVRGLACIEQVVVDRLGESEHFSAQQIKQCMRKVTAVDLMQTIKVCTRRELGCFGHSTQAHQCGATRSLTP